MKKHFLIISFLLFIYNFSFAQYTVKGTVFNDNGKKLEYFNAVLYNAADTSLISGGTFAEGAFELQTNLRSKCILKISYVGLQEYEQIVDFTEKNTYQIDSIVLSTISLSEVVVKSNRPKYSYKNGNVVMNVQNSSLQEAGSSVDVLKRTPGVIVDNANNINIFGKGSPQIYIDGKLIKSNADLELLPSSDIKTIEVDKTPSSEYGASVNAVIRIETKTIKDNTLNAQIYNTSHFARKFNNRSGIKLNSQIGKLNIFASYLFGKGAAKNYFEEFDYNYFENYIIKNNSDKIDVHNSLYHNVITGVKFKIDDKKSIDFQYGYNNKNGDCNSLRNQRITNSTQTNQILREINNLSDEKSNNHNFTLFYNQKFRKSNEFTSTFDFVNLSYDENTTINEKVNTARKTSYIFNKNNNQILSFKTDFIFGLFKDINSKFGVKVSNVRSDGESVLRHTSDIKTDNDINDLIAAGYLNLSKQLDKIEISLGLRNEFTKNTVFQDNINVIDSSYNNLFPSFMLDYTISDNFSITLDYAKKISRPTFKEMNPRYIYVDSLAYYIGNPLLKPTITDNLSLSFLIFGSLNISSEFIFYKNESITTALKDETNPAILKYTYVNIPESKHLAFDASYGYNWDKSSLYFGTGIDFPFLEVPYMNGYRKIRKPMWYAYAYYDYSFNKYLYAYSNTMYQSGFEDNMTIFEDYFNMSVGLQVKLLNKKLVFSFDVNDIFNTSDIEWIDKYGTIENGQTPDYDLRYLRVSVKYYFNNFIKKFEDKSSISDEKQRLMQ